MNSIIFLVAMAVVCISANECPEGDQHELCPLAVGPHGLHCFLDHEFREKCCASCAALVHEVSKREAEPVPVCVDELSNCQEEIGSYAFYCIKKPEMLKKCCVSCKAAMYE